MVHIQYQQFIATLLLGGVVLQGCGNPRGKLEEADDHELDAKAGGLEKFPDYVRSRSPRPFQDSENNIFVETATSYSESLDGVVHEVYGDRCIPSFSTLVHIPLVSITTPQHMPTRPSFRLLSATALGSSDHMSVSTHLFKNPSFKSENEAITSFTTPRSPFFLAFGQEVLFIPVGGYWWARVKDIWGTLEITLPVICKEDVSVALHNLQSQEAVHTQRRIHILETDQSPWAVYIGLIGLRGGMEKKSRPVQEQTDAVHASRTMKHAAVSDFRLHEASYNEQYDEARQAERRKIASERRRQKILANAANRLASIKDTCPVDHKQKEYAKGGAKERDFQVSPSNESPTAWSPPFVAREVPTPVLSHLLQNRLHLHTQSIIRTQLAEATKLPSLPRVAAFSTSEEAQSAVDTYLERWSLETPSERAVIWEQGQCVLKNVEVLKKKIKQSYRHQVLGFEMHDIDPLVWNRVLQQQKATKERLKALRGLRTRLLAAFQLNGQELKEVGIQTTMPVIVGEAELYSSDEEVQQLSDQSRRNHAAFVVGIGKVLQGRAKELLALLDDAIGTTITPYIALLSSTPELPDLLGDYTANFLHETDDEAHKAEQLGSLLAEVILQFVPLPNIKKVHLNKIKHKLGQAAQRVALHSSNQSKKWCKKKSPK